jgi:hypothetical protein
METPVFFWFVFSNKGKRKVKGDTEQLVTGILICTRENSLFVYQSNKSWTPI